MDGDELYDMHMCLVCQSTVVGLINYVNHKKYDCPGKQQTNNTKPPHSGVVETVQQIQVPTGSSVLVQNQRPAPADNRHGGIQNGGKADVELGTVISLQDQPQSTANRSLTFTGSDGGHGEISGNISHCGGLSNISEAQAQDYSSSTVARSHMTSLAIANVMTKSSISTTVQLDIGSSNHLLSSSSNLHGSSSQNPVLVDTSLEYSSFRPDAFSPGSSSAVDPNMIMSSRTSGERSEDFFSSLALQSKNQQQNTMLGQSLSHTVTSGNNENLTNDLPISNILNNLNFSDDEDMNFSFSEDDLFEDAFSDSDSDNGWRPPHNHTKGKWKPGQGPVSGGKWKPGQAHQQTGGKWKPGQGHQQTGGKWKPGQGPYSSGSKYRPGRSTGGKWKPGQSLLQNKSTKADKKKKGRLMVSESQSQQEYFCTACNVYFKNRFSYSSHCTGKQHKENVIIGKCYDNDTEGGLGLGESLNIPQIKSVEENFKSDSPTTDSQTTDSLANNKIPEYKTTGLPVDNVNQENEDEASSPGVTMEENICHGETEHQAVNEEEDENTMSLNMSPQDRLKTNKTVVDIDDNDADDSNDEDGDEAENDDQHQEDPEPINLPSEVLVCWICDKKFYSKYVLARHMLSTYHRNRTKGHPDTLRVLEQYNKYIVRLSPFQCSPCQFYFNRDEDLRNHLTTAQHIKLIKKLSGQLICTLCKFVSRDNDAVRDHMDSRQSHIEGLKTGIKPCIIKEKFQGVQCKYCKKITHSRTHMKRHVHYKHAAELNRKSYKLEKNGKFRCCECSKMFKTYKVLNLHISRQHNMCSENYCDICNKTLGDKYSYDRHLQGDKHLRNEQSQQYQPSASKRVNQFEVVNSSEAANNAVAGLKRSVKLIIRTLPAKRIRKNRKKTENKIYKCDHCEHSVTKYSDLRPHYIDVHSNHILVCDICDMTFISQKALKHHNQSKLHQANLEEVEGKNTQNIYQCDVCKHRFTEEGWKQFHMEVYHLHPNSEEALQKKIGGIDITSKVYADYLKSVKHLDRAEKVNCPVCDKSLKKEHVLEHLRLHTGNKPFMCRYCNFGFISALSLRRHLLGHMGLTERKCEECGKEYKKISSYKEHMLQHEMEKAGKQKFMCDICGQAFYLQKQLNNHMRRHGERKFKCSFDNCHWSFYFSNELESHMRSHTREKPFLCDICGYAAATKNRLLRHSRTHTGERKFHCEYCTYKAGTSTHLRRHMRIHIGSKPYKCPYCDYSCNTHENIRKHIVKTKKHAGLSIYPCKFCPFGTNKVTEFREHLVDSHPNEVEGSVFDGLAEMTGLYNKEQDPRKPSEGMRINPIKERKVRLQKKQFGVKKRENTETSGKIQQKVRSEYVSLPDSMMVAEQHKIPSHLNPIWHDQIEKEARDAAAILVSAGNAGASGLHPHHHTTALHGSLGLMSAYNYYPEALTGRGKVDSPYVPNGSTTNLIRMDPHASLQNHGHQQCDRPDLIIDYLEMEVQDT
ncbi:uncharacterized protein LOC110448180 [Mizuhopecten yessoensis]|uniref:uncharacterized protein LOC110448180 n=1 Tax=Mizuhopecten yessoensis TaxID=6573 RepID=UPI000B45B5E8|nr:uncharacterized protein LOC110448180 [Mizuhopecten yessoensis]XP_021349970.1 uncharacterized protein LOC110448180 [Mizuhopecten yessoensis]